MELPEVIALFAPGSTLTEENLQVMRKLTDAEIEALAKAYPDNPMGKSYLLLYDTSLSADKQLYSPSTWQNLHNLRKFHGRKNLIPWGFRDLLAKRPAAVKRIGNIPKPVRQLDLSAAEAAKLLADSLTPPAVQTSEAPVQVQTATTTTTRNQKGQFVPKQTSGENLPADQQFTEPDESE